MDVFLTIAIVIISGVVGGLIGLLTERYKSRKNIISMVRNQQLPLYTELWSSLYDLKMIADELWKKADSENIKKFSNQLEETELKINKNRILIEEKNKQELMNLIKEFWNFNFGKEKLINLRGKNNKFEELNQDVIRYTINSNGIIKERYDNIINDLEKSLRKQLRTP